MLHVFLLFLTLVSFVFAQGIGQPAPDFTLTDLNNQQHTLSNYRGKVVYIFWFGYS